MGIPETTAPQESNQQTETPEDSVKTFTQEDVDRIVQKRLASEGKRERNKALRTLAGELGLSADDNHDVASIVTALIPPKPTKVEPISTPAPPQGETGDIGLIQSLSAELAEVKKAIAEQKAQQHQRDVSVWKKEAIASTKLPEFLEPQITGSNLEEIEESAKSLLDAFNESIPQEKRPKGKAPTTHASAGNTGMTPRGIDNPTEEETNEYLRKMGIK